MSMTLNEMVQFILEMTPEQRVKLGWPENAQDIIEDQNFMSDLNDSLQAAINLGAVDMKRPEDTREHPCEFCPEEATWAIQAHAGVIHLWCDDCDEEVRRVNIEASGDPNCLQDAVRIDDLKNQEEE